jgi:cyclin-dependent kinase
MSKKIADRYLVISKLGEGAYGTVFLAEDLKNNNVKVAVKQLKGGTVEEGVPISCLREISLLKELAHINIVKLMDVIHLNANITLVFEYVETDLKELLKKNQNQGLPPKLYKSFLYQLLQGIQNIHKMKILHRDIKSENLLISEKNILKITDFGLARGYGLPIKNFRNDVVSLWYRAPDIILGNENYERSVDMWSIGCIFGEMVTGNIFFKGFSENDQLRKIFELLGTPNEKWYKFYMDYPEWKNQALTEVSLPGDLKKTLPQLDDDGIDLISKLLELDPEKRILAPDALKHPFFKDLDEDTKKLYQ